MKILYKVELNKIIDDIIQIKELSPNITIYTLLPIESNLEYEIINIDKLNIKNTNNIAFIIDCKEIKKTKNKILKKIKKIREQKQFSQFEIIVDNYDENEEKNIMDIIRAIKIEMLDTIEKRYNYIYDTVCNYLDKEFICKNICDFENNRCIAKRDYNITCGCCRHIKNKKLLLISNKFVECEYLKNKQCTAQCLTCKLFTCDYIIKHKKIKYRIRNIFLLNYYFNPIQKLIILTSYFTTKDEIIKRLLKWR